MSVRVEEELKTQSDLIRQGFADVNRRLEEQAASVNARFYDVNKRDDRRKKARHYLLPFQRAPRAPFRFEGKEEKVVDGNSVGVRFSV